MRLVRLLAAPALLLAAACASGGGSAESSSSAADASPRAVPGGRDLITRAEIERAEVQTAYDAVARLRPAFLRTRGRSSINSPMQVAIVYMDGNRMGGPETLHRISAMVVGEIRYLTGPEATVRFGTGHEGGAILVLTRR